MFQIQNENDIDITLMFLGFFLSPVYPKSRAALSHVLLERKHAKETGREHIWDK